MAIWFLLMVRFMVDHLSIPDTLLDGAVKPLMSKVVIIMFTFSLEGFLLFLGVGLHRLVPPGVPFMLVCLALFCLRGLGLRWEACRGGQGKSRGHCRHKCQAGGNMLRGHILGCLIATSLYCETNLDKEF